MINTNQTQKAGNGAQQIQVETVIVNNGLTELQVREIIKSEIDKTLKENQIFAEDIARKRLDTYTDVLLPKLIKANMLDAFKEPAIQMLYKNTQRTAISTERENDYSILSELLTYRVVNNSNTSKKASIEKAVGLVNNVTDEALLGLTVHYCVNMIPMDGDISEGLNILNGLYCKIIKNQQLPASDEWLDNLEILGLGRIETISSMKKIHDLYFEKLIGYTSAGIEKNSESHKEVVNMLQSNNIPLDILVEHELNPNHVRLNISAEQGIENIEVLRKINVKNKTSKHTEVLIKLTTEQKNILRNVFDKYKNDSKSVELIKNNFIAKFKEYQYLNMYGEWWDKNTKPAFILNSVGKVLAHMNAKRLYEDFPDLV
ncbi:MAG: hypothetical protein PHG03_06050 [Bacilli bacterium]|nr:hypothetical protein [Bacilli bacterium]